MRTGTGKKIVLAVLAALQIFLAGCATGRNIYTSINDENISSAQIEIENPSLLYKALELGINISSYKEDYQQTPEKLGEWAIKNDNTSKREAPSRFYRKFTVKETQIADRTCYLISPKDGERKDAVVFYLYGGGMVRNMSRIQWRFVEDMLTELKMPVYVPMYPIYPARGERVVHAIIDAYKQLNSDLPNAKIYGLGVSSGAGLLLSICHYFIDEGTEIKMPDKLILISPAEIAGVSNAILEKMKEIEPHDVIGSIDGLNNLRSLFKIDNKDINSFSAPFYGDFSKFPPIYAFSGTYDIYYAEMEPFIEQVRATGGEITLYTGYKMAHCWPTYPITKEAGYAKSVIFSLLKE